MGPPSLRTKTRCSSPVWGSDLEAYPQSPWPEPEPHTYQPDLAGVERLVRRPFGLRPGVPCELRLLGNWVFPRTRSPPPPSPPPPPPMMTETTECKGCHHLGHRLSSPKGRLVQKPELFCEFQINLNSPG